MEQISFGRIPKPYRRACNACTASKRRCTKETPTRQRCLTKGANCTYPPICRQDGSIPDVIGPAPGTGTVTLPIDLQSNNMLLDINFAVLDDALHSTDSQLRSFENTYSSHDKSPTLNTIWFLEEDTWYTEHLDTNQEQYAGEESLEAYITTVQTWFQRWTIDNHCPLIHRQLYQNQMPRCIQDAFMVHASYLNKTPLTKRAVFQIIQDRASDLIQLYSIQDSEDLTLLEHYARVLALLVYQLIRLFAGNIRLRACAETNAPILASWNSLLLQKATREMATGNPASLSASPFVPLTPWKAWCVVESIRRTWLTVAIVQSVHSTMREGLAACPGGVVCTFGEGVWDAENETEWKRKAEGKKLFMHSLRVGELLLAETPENVDEFGHAVVLISHGIEQKEQWAGDWLL